MGCLPLLVIVTLLMIFDGAQPTSSCRTKYDGRGGFCPFWNRLKNNERDLEDFAKCHLKDRWENFIVTFNCFCGIYKEGEKYEEAFETFSGLKRPCLKGVGKETGEAIDAVKCKVEDARENGYDDGKVRLIATLVCCHFQGNKNDPNLQCPDIIEEALKPDTST